MGEGIKSKFCREVQSVFLCVPDHSTLWEHRWYLILLIFCPESWWIGPGNSSLWSYQQSLELRAQFLPSQKFSCFTFILPLTQLYIVVIILAGLELLREPPGFLGNKPKLFWLQDVKDGHGLFLVSWGVEKVWMDRSRWKMVVWKGNLQINYVQGVWIFCAGWREGKCERKPEAVGSQKEKWRLKEGGRPIRKAETEKEWEAKMVWEVSKESRGQRVEAGKVWWR